MAPNHNALKYYRKTLKHAGYLVACPDCHQPVSTPKFEDHYATEHGFNTMLGCAWCQNYFWPKKKKSSHAKHLLDCSRMHLTTLRPTAPPVVPASVVSAFLSLFDRRHAIPKKDAFGMKHDLPEKAHALPRPLDFWDRYPRYCADDHLHQASVCLRWYLDTYPDYEWWHVMVRSVAYDSFLACLDSSVYILPFACWCDGGRREDEARHRQHRHLILVSTLPKDAFAKKLWSRVKIPKCDRPYTGYLYKRLKAIVSPLHLVNTMGYLSNRKSRCDFTKNETLPEKEIVYQDYHFFIHQTLPVDFRIPLVLLWPGGVMDLLYQERLQNASVRGLIQHPLEYVDGNWQQALRELEGLPRGRVLPVLKTLMPILRDPGHPKVPYRNISDRALKGLKPKPWDQFEEAGLFNVPQRILQARTLEDFYLHLGSGRKLYFTENPDYELLDPETWLRKQADGGNVFYEMVEAEVWIPRPAHQQQLNLVKPYANQNKLLASEMEAIRQEAADSRQKYEALRASHATLCDQNAQHEAQHKASQAHILQLYDENKTLNTENRQLNAENRHLHAEINQNYKVEIARLKALVHQDTETGRAFTQASPVSL